MPKLRSFNNLDGKRGKRRTDQDSAAGQGANSQGGRKSRSVGLNRDQSSGMQRERSPRRLS